MIVIIFALLLTSGLSAPSEEWAERRPFQLRNGEPSDDTGPCLQPSRHGGGFEVAPCRREPFPTLGPPGDPAPAGAIQYVWLSPENHGSRLFHLNTVAGLLCIINGTAIMGLEPPCSSGCIAGQGGAGAVFDQPVPGGPLRSVHVAGACLDVAPSGAVVWGSCNGSPSQHWTRDRSVLFSKDRHSEKCLGHPNDRLCRAATLHSGPPKPMTLEEGHDQMRCTFTSHVEQSRVAWCRVELTTQRMVREFLQPDDVVLETGARYGTTSCAISMALNNSGHHIAVEPDESVWSSLVQNRHDHNCDFWLLRGVVADREPHIVTAQSYGTRTFFDDDDISTSLSLSKVKDTSSSPRAAFSLADVQSLTKLQLTALVIDCEGCIDSMLPSDLAELCQALVHVRTIVLEGDMPMREIAPGSDCERACTNYTAWEERFNKLGFSTTVAEVDDMFPWIINYAFGRRSGERNIAVQDSETVSCETFSN